MSNNLNLTQMTSGQNSKYQTHNDTNGELDAAISVKQSYAVDSSNAVTVTTAEQRRASIFELTEGSPAPSAGITMTFPATTRGLIAVLNKTGQTVTVTISGQSITAPTIATNTMKILSHDGVNIQGP